MADHMNASIFNGTPDEMFVIMALLVVFTSIGVVEIRAAEPVNRPGVRGVGLVFAFNFDALARGGSK